MPPGPTVLAAIVLPKIICPICKKPFPKILQRTTGLPFVHCATCNKKIKDKVPVLPTPEQFKKAQAVILAAGVTYNTKEPESTPPSTNHPTNPDADYLTKYLHNYSLAATTTTPDLQPSREW